MSAYPAHPQEFDDDEKDIPLVSPIFAFKENRKLGERLSDAEAHLLQTVDDDGDWDEEKHDANGNGKPDVGEFNVDEQDEGRLQVNDISLFPIIPTIGFSWEF